MPDEIGNGGLSGTKGQEARGGGGIEHVAGEDKGL